MTNLELNHIEALAERVMQDPSPSERLYAAAALAVAVQANLPAMRVFAALVTRMKSAQQAVRP